MTASQVVGGRLRARARAPHGTARMYSYIDFFFVHRQSAHSPPPLSPPSARLPSCAGAPLQKGIGAGWGAKGRGVGVRPIGGGGSACPTERWRDILLLNLQKVTKLAKGY